jgi:cell division septal protein FtsQ
VLEIQEARMTPEEESNDVREMVWEMSRMTNRILIFAVIIIIGILVALIYLGIISSPL